MITVEKFDEIKKKLEESKIFPPDFYLVAPYTFWKDSEKLGVTEKLLKPDERGFIGKGWVKGYGVVMRYITLML